MWVVLPPCAQPATTFQLNNHLGSVNFRLSDTGSILDREEYYPFGDSSVRTWADGSKRFRYVGKEKDAESQLYYYGARYYSAWTCRFISVDPLAWEYSQLNSYNYAANEPIGDFDIDGMQATQTSTSANQNSKSTTSDSTSTQNVQPSTQSSTMAPSTLNSPTTNPLDNTQVDAPAQSQVVESTDSTLNKKKISLHIVIIETETTGEIDGELLQNEVEKILKQNIVESTLPLVEDENLNDYIEVNVTKRKTFLSEEDEDQIKKDGSQIVYISDSITLDKITSEDNGLYFAANKNPYAVRHLGIYENSNGIAKVDFNEHKKIGTSISKEDMYKWMANTVVHEGIGHPLLELGDLTGDHRASAVDDLSGQPSGNNIMNGGNERKRFFKQNQVPKIINKFHKEDIQTIIKYISKK